MCPACSAIAQHQRNAKGHAHLHQEGKTRKSVSAIGQARIKITHFRCKVCGTKWQYEDDKNDDHAGWSVGR